MKSFRQYLKEDKEQVEEYVLIGYDRYHDIVRDIILDVKDQSSAKAQAKKKVDEYEKSGGDDEDLSWELEWQLVDMKKGDVISHKVIARF